MRDVLYAEVDYHQNPHGEIGQPALEFPKRPARLIKMDRFFNHIVGPCIVDKPINPPEIPIVCV